MAFCLLPFALPSASIHLSFVSGLRRFCFIGHRDLLLVFVGLPRAVSTFSAWREADELPRCSPRLRNVILSSAPTFVLCFFHNIIRAARTHIYTATRPPRRLPPSFEIDLLPSCSQSACLRQARPAAQVAGRIGQAFGRARKSSRAMCAGADSR